MNFKKGDALKYVGCKYKSNKTLKIGKEYEVTKIRKFKWGNTNVGIEVNGFLKWFAESSFKKVD